MTEQQERLIKDILSTVRSIQNASNQDLINIVSRITEEVFSRNGMYRIVLNSNEGANRKVLAIKVLREHTDLGLKEAKEILDKLDSEDSITFLEGDHAKIIQVQNDLDCVGIHAKIEALM